MPTITMIGTHSAGTARAVIRSVCPRGTAGSRGSLKR